MSESGSDRGSPPGPIVFISWAEDCSRSDNIAARLGGQSFMVYAPFWGSHPATIVFKYISQAVKTWRILRRERPRTVFVMTPPPFAALPVWLYCLVTGGIFFIDAHSGSFINPRWRRLQWLNAWIGRRAAATLVTNENLARLVAHWGAVAELAPDVPITAPELVEPVVADRPTILFVCTFSRDEPVDLLFDAAEQLPDVEFYVSGNPAKASRNLLARKPPNVTLTGFVPRKRYLELLLGSTAVMTLTTLDNTMQRGAYEAIYLGKPVITSDQPFLRQEFPLGTVHATLTPIGIRRAIEYAVANSERLHMEASRLRSEKLARWATTKERIAALARS